MSQPVPEKPIPVAVPVNTKPSLTKRATVGAKKHYSTLSGWKKLLLVLSFIVAMVGSIGAFVGIVKGAPPEAEQAQATVESLRVEAANSNNFSPEQKEKIQQQLDDATARAKAAGHWFYQKTAPHLARIGFGFFIAFILGYAFRQFIKTMASLAAIVLVGAGVAAYFGWVDFSSFRGNLTASTGWVSDQLTGAKDVILKFIGASLSGTVGFVIGFMRR